jgi:hypothetical protein
MCYEFSGKTLSRVLETFISNIIFTCENYFPLAIVKWYDNAEATVLKFWLKTVWYAVIPLIDLSQNQSGFVHITIMFQTYISMLSVCECGACMCIYKYYWCVSYFPSINQTRDAFYWRISSVFVICISAACLINRNELVATVRCRQVSFLHSAIIESTKIHNFAAR